MDKGDVRGVKRITAVRALSFRRAKHRHPTASFFQGRDGTCYIRQDEPNNRPKYFARGQHTYTTTTTTTPKTSRRTWLASGAARRAEHRRPSDHLEQKHHKKQDRHVARRHHGVVRVDGLRDGRVLLAREPHALVHQDPANHCRGRDRPRGEKGQQEKVV